MWGLNKLLDRSILFSFDRGGFNRHARKFNPEDLKVNLNHKICLLTGANSGLGFETAKTLSKMGATVILVCRNKKRGEAALKKIAGKARLELLDVSDLQAVATFVSNLKESRIDILIHNAGHLPDQREVTLQGHERVLATHVLGPFLLTRLLLPKLLQATQPKIIFVSSGGMYAQKLNLDNIQSIVPPYDGVRAYANAKRAQVLLAKLWSKKISPKTASFYCMHPGWANTSGVSRSLPRFWRIMKSRLRTPKEGADTMIWLAANPKLTEQTGEFWFDRQPAPTHLFPWTHETPGDRQRLWGYCHKHTQPFMILDTLQLEKQLGLFT
jgi:NAD(P)-dependent dehydrogenase (short-subunit alcohol dehydrogenase family)